MPISLLGSIYKILAKVLDWRIQKVLLGIIFKEQGDLVQGRQILDDILVVNECVHSRYKDRPLGIICKLDVEKPYDRVYWKFLQYMHRRMGFGKKLRKWIQEYVSSAWVSFTINGTPRGFFSTERGLRQRDRLSSLLFLIVGVALGRMIKVAVDVGLFVGFKVAGNT